MWATAAIPPDLALLEGAVKDDVGLLGAGLARAHPPLAFIWICRRGMTATIGRFAAHTGAAGRFPSWAKCDLWLLGWHVFSYR